MPKLTETAIAGLPADGRDRILFDSSAPGFGIRVTKAGTKIYIAQARIAGAVRRVSIGLFSEKPLKDAREEGIDAVRAMRRGDDPRVERAARAKAIKAGQTTVAQFAERWLAEYVRPKLKPRTVEDYERLIEQRLKPAFGHLFLSMVKKEDVLKFHAEMSPTPRRANYAVATFRALMSYAEDCGLRPPMSNPARRIKLYRERPRERFLSEAEIGKAAEAISKAERSKKIGPHAAGGLRLALFTGARSGEITGTKWSHVDWDRKLIRLPDSKTNQPRTIHLSDAALEVLKGLPRVGKFIVAGTVAGEPFKNLSRAWIVAREFAKGRGDKVSPLADVRLHDLRHSYASLAASRGVSLQMIGMLLGHRVAATTQRYAHLARDAAAAVNDELGVAIVGAISKEAERERDGSNVVTMERKNRRRRQRQQGARDGAVT